MEFKLNTKSRKKRAIEIDAPVVRFNLPEFDPDDFWHDPTTIAEQVAVEFDMDSVAAVGNHLELRRSLTDALTDGRQESERQMQDVVRAKQKLQEMFNALLKDLDHRRINLQQEHDKLRSELYKNNQKIEEETRLLSELLSKQGAIEELQATEKRVRELVENFDAWAMARDYQQDSILFTVNVYLQHMNGVLNADDMSLGKTFQTVVSDYILCLLFEQEHGRKPKCLWLTKKSLVKSNVREILRWNPSRRLVPLAGGDPNMREFAATIALTQDAMLVCNYEAVRTTDLVRNTPWDFVYIDEVHKLKGGANPGGPTAIWEAVKKVCRESRFMIFLSGTPMVNRPEEMWAYLHIFAPEAFPDLKRFIRTFSDYTYDEKSGKMIQRVDAQKLITLLKKQTIRRRRDEVGIQLPSFEIEHIFLEMDELQRKTYDQMKYEFFIWLDEQEGKTLNASAIIAQLTRLRQINVWADGLKMKWVDPDTDMEKTSVLNMKESVKVDWAMDKIEELYGADEQVVVFSAQFNGPIEEIHRRCIELGIRSALLTGDNSALASDYEEAFQNGEIDVFLINMATGSEGLNLHKDASKWKGGARFGILLDRWWSPARNEQAWSRIHRPGAVDPVVVWFLHNESSVDQFMSAILEEKAALFHTIIEADELRPAHDWRKMLEELI